VLGRGIIRPFRRDDKNDFANAEGEDLVRSCVGQLLNMRGASPAAQGELEWDPERGSLLYLLRQKKNNPMLKDLAKAYAMTVLQRFEPRVRVKSVVVDKTQGADNAQTLIIRLRYDVIRVNVPGNQVILSDVDQNVTLSLS